MQEQHNNKYKTQTFTLDNKLYLYHIICNTQNSTIKFFNSDHKLRLSQHLQLPANSHIHTSQNYIIAQTAQHLHLYQIPLINSPSISKKPFSSQIKLIMYNKKLNLILVLTSINQLYYVLPEIGVHRVKLLFKCQDSQGFGSIGQIMVDCQGDVLLYDQAARVLHTLRFNWADKDQLISKQSRSQVYGIYWSPVFSNSILIHKSPTTQPQFHTLSINTPQQQYHSNVPICPSPIIKSTNSSILYLDLASKTVVLVHQNQQIVNTDINIVLPVRSSQDKVIFNVRKIKYNVVELELGFYDTVRERFEKFVIPLRCLDNQDEGINDLMYIHNNVHLILTDTGLQTHFTLKTIEFLGQNLKQKDHSDTQILAYQLLKKLFQVSPSTISKLANAFIKTCRSKNNVQFLTIYAKHIWFILQSIISSLQQVQNKNYSIQHSYIMYKRNRGILERVTRFTSILLSVIKQVQLNSYDLPQNQMQQQQQNPMQKYFVLVQKSKSLYLLNEIFYKNRRNQLQKKQNSSSSSSVFYTKAQQQAMKEKQKKQKNMQQQKQLKISSNTCHQLFDESFKDQLAVEDIFRVLKLCQNFLFAAYLYTYYVVNIEGRSGDGLQIPYISDNQTIELLKFLVISSNSTLKDRQRLKDVYKNLPLRTSKALLLNQPTFLKHLCSLSINSHEHTSCLCILLSRALKCDTEQNLKFVMKCLILCGRTSLAHQQLQNYLSNRKRQQHQIEKLKSAFVHLCIQNKKIKDLLILNNEYQFQDVKDRLVKKFGKQQIQEILSLMANHS